jgi:bacterioferritin-associated ferredoxin
MIVCSCNLFSSRDVRDCLNPGPECPRTPAQVYKCLGCSPQCGTCARTIRTIIETALAEAHESCAVSCGAACPLRRQSVEHETASA